MGIGGDFDPHRCDRARLVVQGAVGPFDRLFEASRDEMSGSGINGVEKGIRIERAQTARPLAGFDRRLGLVARRVDKPLIAQALAAFGLSAKARSRAAAAIAASPAK